MEIRARVQNSHGAHRATLTTNGADKALAIPPGASGFGSSANGGELLFLALATCYCNDIYREAATRGIAVREVAVEVAGQFGATGEAATGVTYHVRVVADAPTDTVAEIQNTLRAPIAVTLAGIEAVSARS